MNPLDPARTWLLRLDSRDEAEIGRAIDDEFAFHLELKQRALETQGLSEEDARHAAQQIRVD